MKDSEIRSQLADVRAALKANEEEHEVLMSLLKGYEGWLRLRGSSVTQLAFKADLAASEENPRIGPVEVQKPPSFRSSVIAVLQEAKGEPLHAREILSRVLARGSRTEGKDPLALTDLQCYSIMKTEPIKKVAPRTWAWTGAKK